MGPWICSIIFSATKSWDVCEKSGNHQHCSWKINFPLFNFGVCLEHLNVSITRKRTDHFGIQNSSSPFAGWVLRPLFFDLLIFLCAQKKEASQPCLSASWDNKSLSPEICTGPSLLRFVCDIAPDIYPSIRWLFFDSDGISSLETDKMKMYLSKKNLVSARIHVRNRMVELSSFFSQTSAFEARPPLPTLCSRGSADVLPASQELAPAEMTCGSSWSVSSELSSLRILISKCATPTNASNWWWPTSCLVCRRIVARNAYVSLRGESLSFLFF